MSLDLKIAVWPGDPMSMRMQRGEMRRDGKRRDGPLGHSNMGRSG